MASTNKTTNLELSQFIGTDKPSWLGDYNTDMSKIDTAVHTASATATGADGKADANATAIGTLASLSTDVKTDVVSAINEVDAHADSASTSATQALASATSAQTTATNTATALDAFKTVFNLTASDLTASCPQVTPDQATYIKCAKNTDGTLAKIYGRIRLPAYNGECIVTTSDSGLRPTSAITINGCALRIGKFSNRHEVYDASYTINTNGTITISVGNSTSFTAGVDVELIACLLFVKDFGDTNQ